MTRRVLLALALTAWRFAAPVHAHPIPFSYVDLRIDGTEIEATIVAHVIDLAHELTIEPADRLFEAEVARAHTAPLTALMTSRLQLEVDGETLTLAWSEPEVLESRQSLRFRGRHTLSRIAGRTRVDALLFPYDPMHQTFVNIYQADRLAAQAILDRGRPSMEFFSGNRQGRWAVFQRFLASGIHHILSGPDHLLFLVGLLLLGGTIRQLGLIVTSFTVGHSFTLSLAVLALVSPPAHIIEPAIALSIIYVGADNVLVRGGRDMRPWIALFFGFIHGFAFAGILREMSLPTGALAWSLFSFNLGVEVGQLAVVCIVASAFALLRSRSEAAGRRVALAGSAMLIAAGTFWFVERIFFAAGG